MWSSLYSEGLLTGYYWNVWFMRGVYYEIVHFQYLSNLPLFMDRKLQMGIQDIAFPSS